MGTFCCTFQVDEKLTSSPSDLGFSQHSAAVELLVNMGEV